MTLFTCIAFLALILLMQHPNLLLNAHPLALPLPSSSSRLPYPRTPSSPLIQIPPSYTTTTPSIPSHSPRAHNPRSTNPIISPHCRALPARSLLVAYNGLAGDAVEDVGALGGEAFEVRGDFGGREVGCCLPLFGDAALGEVAGVEELDWGGDLLAVVWKGGMGGEREKGAYSSYAAPAPRSVSFVYSSDTAPFAAPDASLVRAGRSLF